MFDNDNNNKKNQAKVSSMRSFVSSTKSLTDESETTVTTAASEGQEKEDNSEHSLDDSNIIVNKRNTLIDSFSTAATVEEESNSIDDDDDEDDVVADDDNDSTSLDACELGKGGDYYTEQFEESFVFRDEDNSSYSFNDENDVMYYEDNDKAEDDEAEEDTALSCSSDLDCILTMKHHRFKTSSNKTYFKDITNQTTVKNEDRKTSKQGVQFSTHITIREYAVTIGSVVDSEMECPIQLDWEHTSDQITNWTEYVYRQEFRKRLQQIRRRSNSSHIEPNFWLSPADRRHKIANVLGITIQQVKVLEMKQYMIDNDILEFQEQQPREFEW